MILCQNISLCINRRESVCLRDAKRQCIKKEFAALRLKKPEIPMVSWLDMNACSGGNFTLWCMNVFVKGWLWQTVNGSFLTHYRAHMGIFRPVGRLGLARGVHRGEKKKKILHYRGIWVWAAIPSDCNRGRCFKLVWVKMRFLDSFIDSLKIFT